MLNDLYFKTTCNIRPYFFGPMGGLKIEGPLYLCCDFVVRNIVYVFRMGLKVGITSSDIADKPIPDHAEDTNISYKIISK